MSEDRDLDPDYVHDLASVIRAKDEIITELEGRAETCSNEIFRLMETLHTIASESEEADTVRQAISVIASCVSGPNFIQTHPLV